MVENKYYYLGYIYYPSWRNELVKREKQKISPEKILKKKLSKVSNGYPVHVKYVILKNAKEYAEYYKLELPDNFNDVFLEVKRQYLMNYLNDIRIK